MKDEYVEVIEIVEDGERSYHLKPHNEKYRHYRVEKIPKRLFESYQQHRDEYRHVRGIMKQYFQPVRDRPMYVARNHEREEDVG